MYGRNGKREHPTLIQLMRNSPTAVCHETVDKVFGLLSLMLDDSGVQVDYAKSPVEVYFDVLAIEWRGPSAMTRFAPGTSSKI
jgi:hypothetical protein